MGFSSIMNPLYVVPTAPRIPPRHHDEKRFAYFWASPYVLEGSVRKAGHRVRITGQLIEAATGTHLWADRFDGALEDVFDLQDRVTSSVAGAIEPHLQLAEIVRAQRKATADLRAYDHFLRGVSLLISAPQTRWAEAGSMFSNALALDPEYGVAYAMAAMCVFHHKGSGVV